MIEKIKASTSEKVIFIFILILGLFTLTSFLILKDKCLFVKNHDPKEINLALGFLKEYDVVIASKYLPKSIVKGRSKLRMFISYCCTLVCQVIISNKISDFSNSYRFYKRKCIEKIIKKKIIYKSPIQHLENLIMLINYNYKIKEISTKYIERERGDSSIKVVGLFFYFLEFIHCLARFIIKKII